MSQGGDIHWTVESEKMTLGTARFLLGIDGVADIETSKRAYRQMARLLHPDKYEKDSEAYLVATRLMGNVNDAYRIITTNRTSPSYQSEHVSVHPEESSSKASERKGSHPRPTYMGRGWPSIRLASHYAGWLTLILVNASPVGFLGFLVFQGLASWAKRKSLKPIRSFE